jgi:hypothetical protein
LWSLGGLPAPLVWDREGAVEEAPAGIDVEAVTS